jgi:hypothetical protein
MIHKNLIYGAIALIVLAIALLWAVMALAHSWYPLDCCSGRDCHPVPCAEISQKRERGMEGYSWTGVRYLDRYQPDSIWFPKMWHRYSPDGKCHVCFSYGQTQTAIPRCIFTPVPVQS